MDSWRRWTCQRCGRTGLKVRHRHKAWPKAVQIPAWGDRNGSTKEILAYALVSPIDAHLARYKWRINTGGYVYRRTWKMRHGVRKRYNFYIHREVLGLHPDDPREGHHRDDNPLNCQRWNLEPVTRSQNEGYKHARKRS